MKRNMVNFSITMIGHSLIISDVIEEKPNFKDQIKTFRPVKSAALISGLLTEPSCHANTYRIEMLVHICLGLASGHRKPKAFNIASWLNTELGSTLAARFEDPIEDVFISNVITGKGNYRIFEGTWESSDFYLQRLINVISTLPDDEAGIQFKREIHAILKISEEIAMRRDLSRYSAGNGIDKKKILVPSLDQLILLRRAISFTTDDLGRLEINPSDLVPFIFTFQQRQELLKQSLGNTDLERRPIIHDNDRWFILLPTAISFAIRQYVIKWICEHGYQKSFDENLKLEYNQLLQETSIMGEPLPQKTVLPSKSLSDKTLMDVTAEIDSGRYLHLLIIVDKAPQLDQNFFTPDLNISELSSNIRKHIDDARNHYSKRKGYKQGMTLLIGCSYGRSFFFHRPEESTDWRIEFISAPDLHHLSKVDEESPFFLWKLIDHERFLTANGITIHNVNGLLNLYGWWHDTEYFMLPQEVPLGKEAAEIMIPTDSLADVRKKVRHGWDVHALPLPNGNWVRVWRDSITDYFPEDRKKPQYSCLDAIDAQELLGARIGHRVIWWISTDYSRTELSKDLVFRIWQAVKNWMDKAAPVFEKMVQHLFNSVLIVLDFNNVSQEQNKPITEDILRSCVSVTTDINSREIHINIQDPFIGGFRNPRNIAERILLRALTIGVFSLAEKKPSKELVELVLNEIVSNDDARYVHIFEVLYFRDHIFQYDRPNKIFTDKADIARSKLGLGWIVENSKKQDRFTTAEESVNFLNRLVDVIWARMKPQMHKLNRRDFIEKALRYIEGVEADKKLWQRTIRAVLAIHHDKASAKDIAIQHTAHCNASEIALRLLIEIAVTECPLQSGVLVGILDLSPLMSDILFLFHLGGCSDAIKKGVMDPEVRIAPNGDILTHVGFENEIVKPLGEQFESLRLDHEANRYEKHFEPFELIKSVKGKFPDSFLNAFEKEFGISVDDLRKFRETLENLAIEKKRCVFIARKREIMTYFRNNGLINDEIAEIALERFSVWPREHWDKAPDGFMEKDWYPWRFGRRLSLIARPLVKLEDGDDPQYVVSPGLFGLGFAFILNRYYEAEVEVSECKSNKMRSWIQKTSNRQGHEFAKRVFDAVRSFGYNARLEIKMSALLNEKLDKDWGDVDVLAWNEEENRILAIECKNLRHAKTPNEIAEQLNRFSGKILRNGKHDELLKHIDRCEFLKTRAEQLARTLGTNNNIIIQPVICFSKPIPVPYLSQRFPDVIFLTFDDLQKKGLQ
jgi:hypothetical protein